MKGRNLISAYGGPIGLTLTVILGTIALPFRLIAGIMDTVREWWWRSDPNRGPYWIRHYNRQYHEEQKRYGESS